MNSVSFVNDFRQAVRDVMDATDRLQDALDKYSDNGGTVVTNYFANVNQPTTDPLVTQDILDAGGAAAALIAALGSGPGSNRAKLNKLR